MVGESIRLAGPARIIIPAGTKLPPNLIFRKLDESACSNRCASELLVESSDRNECVDLRVDSDRAEPTVVNDRSVCSLSGLKT